MTTCIGTKLDVEFRPKESRPYSDFEAALFEHFGTNAASADARPRSFVPAGHEHSDRGGHYRWPGWIKICDDNGLVRSMSRKGCSPDNARCEGFFGRLKIEFFYGCDWGEVTIDEFMEMLDAYLRWYRDVRVKSDLDYRSPMQYRRDLGLAA